MTDKLISSFKPFFAFASVHSSFLMHFFRCSTPLKKKSSMVVPFPYIMVQNANFAQTQNSQMSCAKKVVAPIYRIQHQ